MTTTPTDAPPAGWARKIRQIAPLAIVAGAIAAAFALGVQDYLTFDALRQNRDALSAFVAQNALIAALSFMAVYAVATALSLPGGAVLSIASGFMFGTAFGTAWVVVGATLGAVGIFLAARTALGDALKAKAGPWLARMEEGFKENAMSYLLVLRLVPLFPFFVVNLVPAFLGVSLRTFSIATFLGIIPGTFVFVSVGAGLGSVFDQGGEVSASSALTPEVITALVGLAALSMVPVVYKKIKARRPSAA